MSPLQRILDGEFCIQYGVSPCKRDASPRFGCIEKDDPFPATWICRLNDFKLDGFVFHGRSSKRRHRKFLGLPRNECRLHVQPLSINIRNHRRRCSDGKGHDCKSKSDEFQAVNVRHLVHLKTVMQTHIEPTLRVHGPSLINKQPSAEIPHPFLNSKMPLLHQFDRNEKVATLSRQIHFL
jgi:hypothetical protein